MFTGKSKESWGHRKSALSSAPPGGEGPLLTSSQQVASVHGRDGEPRSTRRGVFNFVKTRNSGIIKGSSCIFLAAWAHQPLGFWNKMQIRVEFLGSWEGNLTPTELVCAAALSQPKKLPQKNKNCLITRKIARQMIIHKNSHGKDLEKQQVDYFFFAHW